MPSASSSKNITDFANKKIPFLCTEKAPPIEGGFGEETALHRADNGDGRGECTHPQRGGLLLFLYGVSGGSVHRRLPN